MEIEANGDLFVKSVISLIPLNDCDMVGVDLAEIFLRGLCEPFGLVCDRKLDVPLVTHIAIGIPDGELKYEVVEGGPKICDCVTKDKTGAIECGRQVRHVINVKDILA